VQQQIEEDKTKETFWGGMGCPSSQTAGSGASAGAQDDRAVYGPAGAEGVISTRSVVVWLRYSSGGRVPDFHEREFDRSWTEAFRSEIVRGVQGTCASFRQIRLRWRGRGILPDSAERTDDLPRQIDVCAMRDHRERDAVRTGVGRLCDAGNQQHDTAAAKIYANEGLCQVIFFESDEDCEVSYKDKKGSTSRRAGSCCRACRRLAHRCTAICENGGALGELGRVFCGTKGARRH